MPCVAGLGGCPGETRGGRASQPSDPKRRGMLDVAGVGSNGGHVGGSGRPPIRKRGGLSECKGGSTPLWRIPGRNDALKTVWDGSLVLCGGNKKPYQVQGFYTEAHTGLNTPANRPGGANCGSPTAHHLIPPDARGTKRRSTLPESWIPSASPRSLRRCDSRTWDRTRLDASTTCTRTASFPGVLQVKMRIVRTGRIYSPRPYFTLRVDKVWTWASRSRARLGQLVGYKVE